MDYAEYMFESRRNYRRHLSTYAVKQYIDNPWHRWVLGIE